MFIYQCLPPDKVWLKVKGPKADWSGDKAEGEVENELRLEPCWSMLLIGSLSAMSQVISQTQMWVRAHMPGYGLN